MTTEVSIQELSLLKVETPPPWLPHRMFFYIPEMGCVPIFILSRMKTLVYHPISKRKMQKLKLALSHLIKKTTG
jgi:hypothetical protein